MPEAHESKANEIQHFSATQTGAQVAKALADAYPDTYEFDVQDFTTAAVPPPEPEPALDANGAPIAEASAAGQPQKKKPGKLERQLARANTALEELRERDRKRDLEIAELRGMVNGRQQSAPVAEPRPVQAAPVEEPPAADVQAADNGSRAGETNVPKFDKTRPRIDDFFDKDDPDAEYALAVAEYVADKREFDRRAREETALAQDRATKEADARRKMAERWNAALDEAKRDYPDFDAVVQKPHVDSENKPLMVISNAMQHIARNRPDGPRILYWLGTHPEEAHRIAAKTHIANIADPWAVEEAMSQVREEFAAIKSDLAANPPKPKAAAVQREKPLVDAGDPDDDDEEELEVDPNLPAVSSDPSVGQRVEQQPVRGTAEASPPPGQQAKPDPIERVHGRQSYVNRPVVATPPAVLRTFTPTDYRRKRGLEGSTAARGGY